MIWILHGEQTSASRAKLVTLMDNARAVGQTITRLDAKSLTLAVLDEILGSQSLFDTPRLLVIEELHSLPTSARKKALISAVANSEIDCILWEKRALTATMLKQFGAAKVEEFKLSNSLFAWLDMFGGSKTPAVKLRALHAAEAAEGEYLCFVMIIRQVRLLILAAEGGKIAGPPFMVTKLRAQAQTLELKRLLQLYKRLLELDVRMKSSKPGLNLVQELDLLTVEL